MRNNNTNVTPYFSNETSVVEPNIAWGPIIACAIVAGLALVLVLAVLVRASCGNQSKTNKDKQRRFAKDSNDLFRLNRISGKSVVAISVPPSSAQPLLLNADEGQDSPRMKADTRPPSPVPTPPLPSAEPDYGSV